MTSQKPVPLLKAKAQSAPLTPADVLLVEVALESWRPLSLRLRFPATLEHRYQEQERESRTRMFFLSGIVVFLMYATFLINDAIYRSEDLPLAMLIRLLGVCSVAALVLPWVRRVESMALKEWLMTGLVVNAILVSAVLLQLSRTETSYMDTLLFGFFPLVANIVFRLRFPYALGGSALCSVIMLVVVVREPPSLDGLEFLALVIFVCITGLSLLANHQLEQQERRVWLLRCREQHRLSEHRKSGDKLTQEVTHDVLTEVYNRRYFDHYLVHQWPVLTQQQNLAFIMVDIDHFKDYNDHYGHVQGDICLTQVAAALQGAIGSQRGMVVRYGGEEFLVLLESVSQQQVRGCAERIRRRIRALELVHRRSPVARVVTVSVGAACYHPSRHTSATDLVREADDALYAAKHQGRDRSVMAE